MNSNTKYNQNNGIRRKIACFAVIATGLILISICTPPAFSRHSGEVVGSLEEPLYAFSGATIEDRRDSRTEPTSLGAASADAARITSGADFAIINGGDFYSNLPSGSLTFDVVRGVFAENRGLAVAKVTPKQLAAIIEAGVGHIIINPDESIKRHDAHGAFPQVSGFTFIYDASAGPGARLVSITADNGKELNQHDDMAEYSLCATDYMLSGGFDMPTIPHTELGISLADSLAEYISSGIEVSYRHAAERITAIGSRDSRPLTALPRGLVLLVSVGLIAIILSGGGKIRKYGLSRKPGER